jgi:osmotically-inducible protein OsmY
MNQREDRRLQHQIEQKILAHGVRPPCQVQVAVQRGAVTLTGTVRYDYQKRAALRACRSINGVNSIRDNLRTAGFRNVWTSSRP